MSSGVCIDLLGPMRATVSGVKADVGGPKPKLVLARLALAAPRAVLVDALIETVWDDAPPATARKTMQGYISAIRSGLGGEAVATAGPAYRLALPPASVDVHRFHTLVDRAGDARTAGNPEEAWALLSEGLTLWRGAPLADLGASRFVAEESRRLSELRLAGVEQQMEIGLELGRHDVLTPALEDLVEHHPLRERLWTAWMTALYRTGRQADALAAYRRLRALLVDELGIEPWEVVTDLHQRILAHDPALDRRAERAMVDASRTLVPSSNLPQRLTSFVGREHTIREISDVLRRARVVTLVGVGGVGKSRLAEQVAARVSHIFPHGVWLAELAPLSRGGPVSHAVAAALGIQQQHGLNIAESVIAYCQSKRLLLVVDNCEHLLEQVGGLIERIVSASPEVAVLATSREPLGIAGEQIWPVPALESADARTLFAERAAAVRPGFRVDGVNLNTVDEVCRRLDRLPLAIELAAARLHAMTVTEVAAHLDERFRLLTGGRRTGLKRHQSLRAAIDWSHGLLTRPEQELFAGLAVFSGGFDVAAAHVVCAKDRDRLAVTDLVAGLVEKSMVVVETVGDTTRYRLLETIRDYARERLEATGTAKHVRARHAAHFTALAEQAGPGLSGPQEAYWVDRLALDFDNLRAALDWAMSAGNADLALRLVAYLPDFTYWRIGYESALWAERALTLAGAMTHPLLASVRAGAARGAWMTADYRRAKRLARRAAAADAQQRYGPRNSYSGDVLADVALYEGRLDEALRHYEHEARHARARGASLRLAWALYYVAVCQAVRRTPQAGIAAAEESLALATAAGNPTAVAMALYALGLTLKKSDPKRALILFDDSVQASRSARNPWFEGIALMEAAATRAVHGDAHVAASAFLDALERWERTGDWTQQWLNLRYIVRLFVRLGDLEGPVVLHHALAGAGKPTPLDEGRLAALGEQLGYERFMVAASSGSAMSGAEAVAYARTRLHDRSRPQAPWRPASLALR